MFLCLLGFLFFLVFLYLTFREQIIPERIFPQSHLDLGVSLKLCFKRKWKPRKIHSSLAFFVALMIIAPKQPREGSRKPRWEVSTSDFSRPIQSQTGWDRELSLCWALIWESTDKSLHDIGAGYWPSGLSLLNWDLFDFSTCDSLTKGQRSPVSSDPVAGSLGFPFYPPPLSDDCLATPSRAAIPEIIELSKQTQTKAVWVSLRELLLKYDLGSSFFFLLFLWSRLEFLTVVSESPHGGKISC